MTDNSDNVDKTDEIDIVKPKKKAFHEEAGVSRAIISGTYVTIFSLFGSLLFWGYSVIATGSGGLEYQGLASTIVALFTVFNGGFIQAYIAKIKNLTVTKPEEAETYAATYTKVFWLTGIIMTVLAIITAFAFNDEYISTCIWFVIPNILFSYTFSFANGLLQVKNRYDIVGIIGGMSGTYLFLFGYLFIFLDIDGKFHAFIPLIILILNLIPTLYFFEKKTPFKMKNIIKKGSLKDKQAGKFFKYSLFSTVTNLDVLGIFGHISIFITASILAFQLPNDLKKQQMEIFSIVGSYVVSKVIIQFFSGPLNVELAESIANDDKDGAREVLNTLGRISLILGLLMLIVLVAFGKTLLLMLHEKAFILTGGTFDNELYQTGILLFAFFTIGQFFFGFCSLFGNALVGIGAARLSARGFGIALVLCAVLTAIFVFFFGLVGAGIANLLSSLFLLPYMLYSAKKAIDIEFDFRVLRQLPHLILIFVLFYFYPFPTDDFVAFMIALIIVVLITAVIMLTSMMFWGVMRPEDFNLMKDFLKSIKMGGLGDLMQKGCVIIYNLNPLNKKIICSKDDTGEYNLEKDIEKDIEKDV
ncbi:MAG: hypothetical protein GF364_03000 [Candidatus Lokiarchaeota archaeon]|nr:hypothetical protein [Candidatus Lokiarchaeota archaeon]